MKKIKVAVDIGNSNVVIGLFIENKWEKVYRLSSKKNITYWSFKNKLKKIISQFKISKNEKKVKIDNFFSDDVCK